MDFLITGASGFVGQRLVRALLDRGDTVSYLARKRSAKADPRAAFRQWDGEAVPQLGGLSRIDAVINLMGEPIAQRWTPGVKERIRRSRVVSTRHLVSALSALPHRPALISASAIGFYGDRADEVLTEDRPAGTGFLSDVCVEWEREAERAEEFGMRAVRVRIATVLGRDGGALPQMLTPFKLGIGGRFGSGRQWMSWIHIDDLIRLILFAAANEMGGPVNAAAPQPATNAEFTRTLASVIHRPAIVPIPRFALNIVLGEMASFLFDSLRVVPEKAQKAGFRFENSELGPALAALVK